MEREVMELLEPYGRELPQRRRIEKEDVGGRKIRASWRLVHRDKQICRLQGRCGQIGNQGGCLLPIPLRR